MSTGSPPTEPCTTDLRGRVVWLPGRLVSLDALRGFDMLWILGGDSIGGAMAGLKAGPVAAGVARQLDHVPWEGFRFYDLIFPLFVFMVGVSIVFSMTRLIAKEGKDQAFQRILKRGALLYVLGVLVYNADHHDFVWKNVDDVRLMGVLQRLALCYLITGVLCLVCRLR
ncbi:MAG: heparan-alpha-glucosaminide N-acetyltransferase domain-containing protein, partial [Verrucomicrobiota bacterium]